MKVGVLINNAALFVNGSEQQPQFVIEMLQYLGVEHVVFSHRGRENLCGIERSSKFNETQLQLINNDLEQIDGRIKSSSESLNETLMKLDGSSAEVASIAQGMENSATQVNEASSDYIDEVGKAAELLKNKTDEA